MTSTHITFMSLKGTLMRPGESPSFLINTFICQMHLDNLCNFNMATKSLIVFFLCIFASYTGIYF